MVALQLGYLVPKTCKAHLHCPRWHHAQRGQGSPGARVLQLVVQALPLNQGGDVAPVSLQAQLELALRLQVHTLIRQSSYMTGESLAHA